MRRSLRTFAIVTLIYAVIAAGILLAIRHYDGLADQSSAQYASSGLWILLFCVAFSWPLALLVAWHADRKAYKDVRK